jgi:hypothetical protein
MGTVSLEPVYQSGNDAAALKARERRRPGKECAGFARARFARSAVSESRLRSETEDALNLMPDREHEEDGERE